MNKEQVEQEIKKIIQVNTTSWGTASKHEILKDLCNLFQEEMKELKLQLEAQDANVEILISQKEQLESEKEERERKLELLVESIFKASMRSGIPEPTEQEMNFYWKQYSEKHKIGESYRTLHP